MMPIRPRRSLDSAGGPLRAHPGEGTSGTPVSPSVCTPARRRAGEPAHAFRSGVVAVGPGGPVRPPPGPLRRPRPPRRPRPLGRSGQRGEPSELRSHQDDGTGRRDDPPHVHELPVGLVRRGASQSLTCGSMSRLGQRDDGHGDTDDDERPTAPEHDPLDHVPTLPERPAGRYPSSEALTPGRPRTRCRHLPALRLSAADPPRRPVGPGAEHRGRCPAGAAHLTGRWPRTPRPLGARRRPTPR